MVKDNKWVLRVLEWADENDFDPQTCIAFTWNTDDVRYCDEAWALPDLTDRQCMLVLREVARAYSRYEGCTYDHISSTRQGFTDHWGEWEAKE